MIILDTNAILRCILQDNEKAADFIDDQMTRFEYLIPLEVVAEIVFVLLKVYKIDRNEIERSVQSIINHPNTRIPHKAVVETAIHVFGSRRSISSTVFCLATQIVNNIGS